MTITTLDDLSAAYARYAHERDLEAFLALYAEDVVVFDLSRPTPAVGLPSWRPQVASWFGDLDPADVNVARVQELTVLEQGDLLAAHGTVRYAVLASDGSERYGMTNRLTWLLRRGADGELRIVHEHTSVPVDLDEGRPILD